MQTPQNVFKASLAAGKAQIGLWMALTDPITAQIVAGSGFDWVLIDGEHAPHDLRTILGQLQAVDASPGCHAVVRVPAADDVLIKQYLDLGAQSLLVPMVESAEQAASVVRACRYPPRGIRGVGGARAARWGRYESYLHESDDQIAILVQVESRAGLDNLDQIAAVEGVDGVFVGTADLAASLGYPGDVGHAVVRAATDDAIRRISQSGKAPGILSRDETIARKHLDAGALFVAVGIDAMILASETTALASRFSRDN